MVVTVVVVMVVVVMAVGVKWEVVGVVMVVVDPIIKVESLEVGQVEESFGVEGSEEALEEALVVAEELEGALGMVEDLEGALAVVEDAMEVVMEVAEVQVVMVDLLVEASEMDAVTEVTVEDQPPPPPPPQDSHFFPVSLQSTARGPTRADLVRIKQAHSLVLRDGVCYSLSEFGLGYQACGAESCSARSII